MRIIITLVLAATLLGNSSTAQTVIMEDHFTENENGWPLGEDEWSINTIKNGKLTIECKGYLKPDGGTAWLIVPDVSLPASGFSVSCNTKWLKNRRTDSTYSPYGLIVGNYYFLIYGNGNRRMLSYDATTKKFDVIVDWGVSAIIRKANAGENKLEVVYKEGKAAFYCNGEMLFKKPAVMEDKAGVKIYIAGSEIIEVDDLVIKKM